MEANNHNREEFFRNLFNIYLEICVVLIIFRSDSKNKTMTLACDRSGKYVNRKNLTDENRRRKRTSRLTNCPFRIFCKFYGESWVVLWKVEEHNHILVSAIGHSTCRN